MSTHSPRVRLAPTDPDQIGYLGILSWELGAATQALLEYQYPSFSVYGDDAIPPPSKLPSNENASLVLAITDYVIQTKPPGTLELMVDLAAGDPASTNPPLLPLYTRIYQIKEPRSWRRCSICQLFRPATVCEFERVRICDYRPVEL